MCPGVLVLLVVLTVTALLAAANDIALDPLSGVGVGIALVVVERVGKYLPPGYVRLSYCAVVCSARMDVAVFKRIVTRV